MGKDVDHVPERGDCRHQQYPAQGEAVTRHQQDAHGQAIAISRLPFTTGRPMSSAGQFGRPGKDVLRGRTKDNPR